MTESTKNLIMPNTAPSGGDQFLAPVPGADFDPDNAIMQARALNALQDQMKWVVDLLLPLESEILIDSRGRKFETLVDLLGTDPQSAKKWRLTGSPEAASIENPGLIRSGMMFNTSLRIKDIDEEFDISTINDRLYLEGEFIDEEWKITLKGGQDWSDAYPIDYQGGSDFNYLKFYYPLAITHQLEALENDNITPSLSDADVGVRLVAPDSDLTLIDSYFIDQEKDEGQYMIYPTPPPGDIYLPASADEDAD